MYGVWVWVWVCVDMHTCSRGYFFSNQKGFVCESWSCPPTHTPAPCRPQFLNCCVLPFVSSTFGELKTVRLPKKMTGTGTHRGFGFVDFLTKQDAKVRLPSGPLVGEAAKPLNGGGRVAAPCGSPAFSLTLLISAIPSEDKTLGFVFGGGGCSVSPALPP